MTNGQLQNHRTSLFRIFGTCLTAKMRVGLLRRYSTHQTDSLREPTKLESVMITVGSTLAFRRFVSHGAVISDRAIGAGMCWLLATGSLTCTYRRYFGQQGGKLVQKRLIPVPLLATVLTLIDELLWDPLAFFAQALLQNGWVRVPSTCLGRLWQN